MTDTPGWHWRYPSPRLRWLRLGQVAAAAVLPLVAAVAAGLVFATAWVAGVAVGGVLLAAGCAAVFVSRRVRAWAYAERGDDLLVQRGVMFRRLSVVPYGRMQYVDVVAGPLERAAGLATVHMHTAAAASDARIPGLLTAEAARLRDQLASLGEARAAGL